MFDSWEGAKALALLDSGLCNVSFFDRDYDAKENIVNYAPDWKNIPFILEGASNKIISFV